MKRSLAAALFVVACLGVACLGAASALADVPTLLSYQGVLTDGAGVAVPDGPYSVTFRLYDVPSGGTALWAETDVVQVSRGTFSATLGLVADLGSVSFDMDYYLGLSIGGGAELPRTMLTTAPYSFSSRAVIGSANIFPAAGNVGIGTKYPDEKLHVTGAIRLGSNSNNYPGTIRWTGTDFEGYDGSIWKSLTATGGSLPSGGAGQTLRHDGSGWAATSTLYNSGTNIGIGTTSPVAKLHVGGNVAAGTAAANGALDVYRAGVAGAMASVSSNDHGGIVGTFDEAGYFTNALEPDFDGTGGYFSIYRNPWILGFMVDGNYLGSGQPYSAFIGDSRAVEFNVGSAGDASVALPVDAVSSLETLDEPGIASYGSPYGSELTSSFVAYTNQTIMAPSDGFVLAIGSVNVSPWHVSGTETSIILGVSTDPSSLSFAQYIWVTVPASAPTGNYEIPAAVSGVFPVSAGSHTFYIVVRESSGAGMIYNRTFSLLYVPTGYGDNFVQPSPPPSGDGAKQMAASVPGASDIAATRAASEAANAERMQRELSAMQERLARLETEMRNGQSMK